MITIKIKKSKFMPDDFSAFVSFPYNQDVIDVIKSLKHRSWINASKQWEIRIDDIEILMDEFPQMDFDVSGRYVDLTPKKAITANEFDFKTPCFKHQLEGFDYGMKHDRWLLGDDQGLGKTKQVIDIAVARKQTMGYSHCLIVCGVNGLKWNWANEIVKHSDEKAYILGQRMKKRTGEIYIGSNKDKLYDIQHLDELDAYFIITNVETLRDEAIASEIENWIHSDSDCKINIVAADEVHKMKNPASQQGKAFIKLDSDVRIAMTGTPLMNSPLDLYIILRWLGYEKHAFYSFKKHYAIFGGYGDYEIVGYRNLDELEEQLQSIMLRRLKKNVLDLPEKTYIDEYVDMLPKQAVIYKEIKAEIKANINMIEISPNPLAEMIRLRQATGYTGILSSQIQCSAKLDRMEELVDDATANGNKVVIFSNWTQITSAIVERLQSKGRNPLVITGETPDSLRQQYIDDFQTFANHNIMIGTTGALGTGVTLTAASVMILMDEPWSMALREQAVDRCHRIGQNNNVTIYTLMCKGTIDEKIHKLVYEKGEMSDKIVDGVIAPVSKKEVVDYLLS